MGLFRHNMQVHGGNRCRPRCDLLRLEGYQYKVPSLATLDVHCMLDMAASNQSILRVTELQV